MLERPVVVRVSPAFLRARERLGVVAGSAEARALARLANDLTASSSLPRRGDVELLLPPSVWCWEVRLPAFGLRLVYAFDDVSVTLVTLRR